MPSLYRPRDGWFVRRLFFVMGVGFGAFAAYRMYLWGRGWTWLLDRIPGDYTFHHILNWGEVGAALILAGALALCFQVMFKNRRSVDFLVEVERELREVAWPEYKPVGSPRAELWGSTYVVIAVVIVFTLFIYLVDTGCQALATLVFYR